MEVEEVLVISSSDKDQIYNLMRENVPFYVCSGDSFAEFCDAWTTSNPKSINSERILNAYGSWEVPVKKNPPAGGELDEDGRAVEPECVTTTMKGWVEELRFSSENYLKDYHLYNEVKKRGGDPIYSPTVFCAHDILNPFLDDCTDGDFRFVYWGPATSSTPLHSDVMNTYSWSFNVIGEKEWTFYAPSGNLVTFIQKPGGAIFVPSTWKHEVKNTAETISINHNWISPCAVDLMCDCLLSESAAVNKELEAWGLSDTVTMDEKEKLMRSACGLNMTMFTLMLVRAAVLLLTNSDGGISERTVVDLESIKRVLKTSTDPTRYLAVLGEEKSALLTSLLNEVYDIL